MPWYEHAFFIGIIITMSFFTYAAWWRDWGKKHYAMARKYPFTPFYLISLLGEHAYDIIYRIAATGIALVFIAEYVTSLLNL